MRMEQGKFWGYEKRTGSGFRRCECNRVRIWQDEKRSGFRICEWNRLSLEDTNGTSSSLRRWEWWRFMFEEIRMEMRMVKVYVWGDKDVAVLGLGKW